MNALEVRLVSTCLGESLWTGLTQYVSAYLHLDGDLAVVGRSRATSQKNQEWFITFMYQGQGYLATQCM